MGNKLTSLKKKCKQIQHIIECYTKENKLNFSSRRLGKECEKRFKNN